MKPFDIAWRLLKEEVDDEAFKRSAYGLMDEGWADHLPEDFDHEGFNAGDYNEIVEREYPTGQSGHSPGIKELQRSLYNHYESPEENEERFRDLMDNPTREPILVVRDKNGEEHIIAGHHRMAANIESNRPHLPALILDMNKGIQTGEPMNLAFRLLKAPVYTDDNPPPMQQSRHYEMLPELDKMGGYMWQSEDGLARGTLRPDYFLNSLMINNFEMAGPVRGQNKSRQYLQDMIDQGHGHFGHELTGTHVTNVESHTADFWNKLVDEGMLDGAHERANIRTNLDGDQHFVYAYDKETKQPWNHELSEEYADYHGLPTDAVYDNI